MVRTNVDHLTIDIFPLELSQPTLPMLFVITNIAAILIHD